MNIGFAEMLAIAEPLVRVTVASVDGSTPREAGAAMLVMPESPLPRGEGGVRGSDLSIAHNPSPGAARHPLPRGEGAKRTLSSLRAKGEAIQPSPANIGGLLRSARNDAKVAVGRDATIGTIGGGQLEFEAIAHARAMLAEAEAASSPWRRDLRSWPLGPSLGQCCGGAVRVLFEYFGAAEREAIDRLRMASRHALVLRPATSGEPPLILTARQEARDLPLHVARVASDMLSGTRPRGPAFIPARKGADAWFIEPVGQTRKPLVIYGAGHVGRAIVRAIAELDFAVTWVDVDAARFPATMPEGVTPVIARDPAAIAQTAPPGAYHLVLTYSHALDLAICHALLSQPAFGFLGLIGSVSKRARFLKRLAESGISPAALARLTCPIGIGALRGKEPATIAIAVAAQLIERLEAERGMTRKEDARDDSGRHSA
jgi:xanthine dehydrogenase accessory factor